MIERLRLTRRELLQWGFTAAVGAAPGAWAAAGLSTTPALTSGPFYPDVRPLEFDTDLTLLKGHRTRAQGQRIHVAGRVLNSRGEPIRGVRVEVWQANSVGRYAHARDRNNAPLDPDFQGYGEQVTDTDGRYRFTTVKPGAYPVGGTQRAPHIHFQLTGPSERRVTQLFFAGEELNDRDFVLRGVSRNREMLVAALSPAPAGEDPASRLVNWDIVMERG